MKNIKLGAFLIILLSTIQLSQAQYNAQKKGDYHFQQFAYAKAISEYEKMIIGNLNTAYAHRQLAEYYLFIREFKKSIPRFEMIINDTSLPPDYMFKFGMALYANEQKKESAKWLKKYNKNDPG